ncbi:MAG: S41 family peptidase, partial [Anaerolineales bacterium]
MMESRGFRTCFGIGLGLIVLVLVFVAGAGVGYFVPRLLESRLPVSGPVNCPPCPETTTDGPVTESTQVVTVPPEIMYIDPQEATPGEYEDLFSPFWETWDIVHDEYVDQPVDDLALMRGAIEGMLAALNDKHTSYMTPDEFQQANESLEGEYEGIGAWVDITGDYVEIISPMRGSPADEAGLQPNDIVVGIDGEDMTDIPGDLVLQRILGPAGTDVTLTIQRDLETFDVTITRANIVVPTAESQMLEDNIAYIALYNYGENTTQQLRSALRELLDQNPDGLIFDLRDNGGGYLNTAIEVVSEFIGEGVVMYEQYGDGQTFTYEAIPGGLATEIPMVVLVNEGTASASEITAGAIQDYGRAPLVGVTTYGKGSVQNWIPLENDAGGVRVTTARWLTPNGRQISEVGLEPEYIVEMTQEDVDQGLDPQLDKAIEVLKD